MKTFFMDNIIGFYKKEKELDVVFFKLLGTAGIIISVIGALQSLITAADTVSFSINMAAAFSSLALILYVDRTGHYIIGYLITSFGIFMALFALLFFEMGGLYGSMPYFFSFGILFTLLMYRGKLLVVMEFIHVVFYMGICHFSYLHHEYVKPFSNPRNQYIDQVSGILISSVGIGIIFIMYLREYRKQQKLALESSNAKSILLANISHEIRTPINMLLGMNEMIQREAENSQILEYSQNVDNAGKQLLFMINQFLDLSRIDMGKEELFEENFDLKNLLETFRLYYQKEAEAKQIEFSLETDENLPRFYVGDVRKITQILLNLLSNAFKYTKEGIVIFRVHKLSESDEGALLRFEVSDTGMGIKEEDQERIFESFERLDIVRNRGIEGTGLGLAISGNLARIMGSRIEVKSQYGEGSLFWFDVDLKRGTDYGTDRYEEETFIAPDALILAVDDISMNLTVLKSLLKRTLIKVDTASSALECYDMYKEKDYDLVLMDFMMPDINGVQAMEELRRIDRERKHRKVPVVALTADATPERKKIFIEKGFDGYLLKPIDVTRLERVLIKLLPDDLVTIVDKQEQIELPEKTLEYLTRLLAEYDISFEMAMKHLSGDILQFVRIAEYFVENTDVTMARLKELFAAKDYKKAALIVHSVKGNAGNVGGDDLFYNAKRLESRAKNNDTEYVEAAKDLFFMEWLRVKEGLAKFLQEFEKIKPTLNMPHEKAGNRPLGEENLDEEKLIERLKETVSQGNQTPALKYVDELVKLKGETDIIGEIRMAIKDIDFDKAMTLIGLLGG